MAVECYCRTFLPLDRRFPSELFAVFLGEAESGLAFEAVFLLHLGGVLARFKVEELMYGVGEQRCDVAVQAPEEGVVVGLLPRVRQLWT